MKLAEIRKKFLNYFESKNHEIINSSDLVPKGDDSILFTNAGMVQFKDTFLGLDRRNKSATSSQKCLRVGGKHNDLENVGFTTRHQTFFEMLGNFSFGEYFKEGAIDHAWEFLTEELGIPEEKLFITVHENDHESEKYWLDHIGVKKEKIARRGNNYPGTEMEYEKPTMGLNGQRQRQIQGNQRISNKNMVNNQPGVKGMTRQSLNRPTMVRRNQMVRPY